MLKRPAFVSVLAWVVIVIQSLCLAGEMIFLQIVGHKQTIFVSTLAQYDVRLSIFLFSFLLLMAVSALHLAAATAMLYAKNWGRIIYVILLGMGVGVVFCLLLLHFSFSLVLTLLMFVLIIVGLFRPSINAYFSQGPLPVDLNTMPLSISAVAWPAVVVGGFSLYALCMLIYVGWPHFDWIDLQQQTGGTPVKQMVILVVCLFITLLNLIASVAMLKGKNWGRIVYVFGLLVGVGVQFVDLPSAIAMISPLMMSVLILFCLFSSRANIYFSQPNSLLSSPKRPIIVTSVSYIFLMFLGLVVSVVGWLFIFAWLAKGTMYYMNMGDVFYRMLFLAILFLVICLGLIIVPIAMLKGKNWGRILYLIIHLALLLWLILNVPVNAMVIFPVVLYGVVIKMLFAPSVNAYFLKPKKKSDIDSPSTPSVLPAE